MVAAYDAEMHRHLQAKIDTSQIRCKIHKIEGLDLFAHIVTMIDTEKMIIYRMIENNMPLDEIAQLIGFSVEKVKEILETEKVYH